MNGLPFETATQWLALLLTLVAGWFFGLATRSGKGKWRERYQDLELRHSKLRETTEAELRESHHRIRELEAENARLRTVQPAAGEVVVEPATRTVVRPTPDERT